VVLLLLSLIALATSYNNGYGLKPALGWNTWCAVGECGLDLCTDKQIRETADALVSTGLKALGYEWIILDDCWHPDTRDDAGNLVPNPKFFPNGMKVVAEYAHSLGLKFGIYTSAGTITCRGDIGSYGHFEQDAKTFASWDLDYIKMDWCGENLEEKNHLEFGKALNQTGRPIWLELCRGSYETQNHYGYASSVAQSWRSSGDHHDDFDSVLSELKSLEGKSSWYGPYGWAYLDMLMTGGQGCKGQTVDETVHCPGQTDNQYRTEFSLYAIVASPLVIGTDIRNMTAIMKELLLNTEVLAVNQDHLATPGDVKMSCGTKGYVRSLTDGTFAVAIPNLSGAKKELSVCFKELGWDSTTAFVRDIWAHKDMGSFNNMYNATVAADDTLFVILSK